MTKWSVKPVIFILTSPVHPPDTFLMTIRLLELYTDLENVEQVYICANAVDAARNIIIDNFLRRNSNAQVIHCEPKGHLPCVPWVQNYINEKHSMSPIIKMDDDMFVTPNWLERLMTAWEATKNDSGLGIIAPLTPINFIGLQSMFEFLSYEYAHEFSNMFLWGGAHLGSNKHLHEFMWSKIIYDNLFNKFNKWLADKDSWWPFHGESGYVSINCILYDWRLIEKIHPLPLTEYFYIKPYYLTGRHHKAFDETIMNKCIENNELTGLVVRDAVVHHYAFHKVTAWLRNNISLHDVSNYIFTIPK